jgi:uracil-DNA glycosylase
LLKFGLAEGEYAGEADDGLKLVGAVVAQRVKCLPPGNKPLPEEVATCRNYLEGALAALTRVRVVSRSGRSHTARPPGRLGLWPSAKFGHCAEAIAPDGRILLSSYHPSRQNTNTGKLTKAMFESVFERALELRYPR